MQLRAYKLVTENFRGFAYNSKNIDTRGMTKTQASDRWFDETSRLLQDLNIQTGNLKKQFGLKKEDIEYIAKR